MILQKEIRSYSSDLGVPNATIDKDWVLGHVLNAIYCSKVFNPELVFKGGTSMRKLYYKDYRFSEDLDFTAQDQNLKVGKSQIEQILDFAHNMSDIHFYISQHNEMLFQNKIVGYQTIIKYWGADHPRNQAITSPERWHTFIKIEIVTNEIIVNETVYKPIIHSYSDASLIQSEVPCYNITEMMAEKLRATLQRKYTAPRDYFDLWFMINHEEIDWETVKLTFIQKAQLKNICLLTTH
ncbi:MAG TPA: nucleotidyl transferase AbiEii/AbiGii toxin family protein [Saprospiraceae bacterium]|mgnify:CR=1 FL=1|nr:nucleotidyl transferase AbiEii/AbiGii toxin family protein [Saprospiraceae bacterium]